MCSVFRPSLRTNEEPYAEFSLPTGDTVIALQSREHFEKELPGLVASAADRALVVLQVDEVSAGRVGASSWGGRVVREPAAVGAASVRRTPAAILMAA